MWSFTVYLFTTAGSAHLVQWWSMGWATERSSLTPFTRRYLSFLDRVHTDSEAHSAYSPIPGALSLWVRQAERDNDHSPQPSAMSRMRGATRLLPPCLHEMHKLSTVPASEPSHSPRFNAGVKNVWGHVSTPPYVFLAWWLIKHRGNFAFIATYSLSFANSIHKYVLIKWMRSTFTIILSYEQFRLNKESYL
jgi:hypothetical protein